MHVHASAIINYTVYAQCLLPRYMRTSTAVLLQPSSEVPFHLLRQRPPSRATVEALSTLAQQEHPKALVLRAQAQELLHVLAVPSLRRPAAPVAYAHTSALACLDM